MKQSIFKSAAICLLVCSLIPIRPCEVHASGSDISDIHALSEESLTGAESDHTEVLADAETDHTDSTAGAETEHTEEMVYVDFSDEDTLTEEYSSPAVVNGDDEYTEHDYADNDYADNDYADNAPAAVEYQTNTNMNDENMIMNDENVIMSDDDIRTPQYLSMSVAGAGLHVYSEPPYASVSWRFRQVDDVRRIVTEDTEILTAMSTDAVAAGTIRQYGLVHVLSEEADGWVYVESGEVRGFIRAELLDDAVKLTGIRCQKARDLVAEGKNRREALKTGKPAEGTLSPSENDAWLYRKITYRPVVVEKKYGLVKTETDPLNVRCGPGTDYEVIAQIPRDGIACVLQDAESSKTVSNRGSGDTTINEDGTDNDGDDSENEVENKDDGENKRTEENKDDTEDDGQRISAGRWLYVESGNIKGYVCADYIDNSTDTQEQIAQAGESSFSQAYLLTQNCLLLEKALFSTFTSVLSADSQEAGALDAQLSRELRAAVTDAAATHLYAGSEPSRSESTQNVHNATGNVTTGIHASGTGYLPDPLSPDSKAETTGETAGASAEKRQQIVSLAASALGCPYVWGGNDLYNGCDCSGFTQQIYQRAGISLPRTAQAQAYAGTRISFEEIRPGDLIFYAADGYIHHTAVYTGRDANGNARTIEAYGSDYGIIEANAFGRDECWACTYL